MAQVDLTWHNDFVSFCISGQQHSRTASLLVVMVIPGSLIFLCVIAALHGGHTSLTPVFILFYELATILQVNAVLFSSTVHYKVVSPGFDIIDCSVLAGTCLMAEIM